MERSEWGKTCLVRDFQVCDVRPHGKNQNKAKKGHFSNAARQRGFDEGAQDVHFWEKSFLKSSLCCFFLFLN